MFVNKKRTICLILSISFLKRQNFHLFFGSVILVWPVLTNFVNANRICRCPRPSCLNTNLIQIEKDKKSTNLSRLHTSMNLFGYVIRLDLPHRFTVRFLLPSPTPIHAFSGTKDCKKKPVSRLQQK